MYNITIYFLLFIIYSIAGWIIEVVGQLIQKKKVINRGFLIGPYCPIYGYGSVLITLLLTKYQFDFILVFVLAVLICGVLEYITSYGMEKLFNARWWDYSKKRFNINGRICLDNLILFGLGGTLIIYIFNPFILKYIYMLPNITLNILAIILFLIYINDTIISFNIIFQFRKVTLEIKDNTEEISKRVRDIISQKSILGKRLMSAFPNLETIKEKLKIIHDRR